MNLPPNYVNVPAALVYSNLPPKIRDTYIQLRGLAWKSGYKETPPVTFGELAALFGKSQSTVYEHVRSLGEHSWLLFRNAGGPAYTFSFPDAPQPSEYSESPAAVSENSETPIPLLSNEVNPLMDSEKEKSAVPKNRKAFSGKPQSGEKKRAADLSHPAAAAYRRLTQITPNAVQRAAILQTVQDLELWRLTLEHWLEHGWRPTNIPGMLDSYRNGGRAGCTICKRNGSGNSSGREKATITDIDDIFTRLEHGSNP